MSTAFKLTPLLLICFLLNNKEIKAQVRYYDIIRYNDRDFSYLKNDTSGKDLFNGIKYIPLNKTGTNYLTLGGEVRENYQWTKNENWGDIPPTWVDDDGFIWHRLMVHSDLKIGKKIRVFAQLKNAIVISRAGGERAVIDRDDLSLHQAFIDYKFNKGKEQFTIRAGRQEHNFGWGKLVSVREGPNNRQTFDGLTFIHENKNWNSRLFFANDVSVANGVFDNKSVKDQYIYGIYSTHQIPSKAKLNVESYYIGSNRPAMILTNKIGTDKRHTVGVKLGTLKTGFLYEIEGIYQFGKFSNITISAYSVVGMVGYEWRKTKLQPKVQLFGGITTGDKAATVKHNTFNPLYPRPPFSQAFAFGVSNIDAAQLEISIRPIKPMRVSGGSFLLQRNSVNDGIYTPGVTPIRPMQWQNNLGQLSKNLAIYNYIDFEYFVGRHWQINFQGAIVPPGDYIKQTGKGQTIYYLMAQTTFRF
jgi:hypothetical protein